MNFELSERRPINQNLRASEPKTMPLDSWRVLGKHRTQLKAGWDIVVDNWYLGRALMFVLEFDSGPADCDGTSDKPSIPCHREPELPPREQGL